MTTKRTRRTQQVAMCLDVLCLLLRDPADSVLLAINRSWKGVSLSQVEQGWARLLCSADGYDDLPARSVSLWRAGLVA